MAYSLRSKPHPEGEDKANIETRPNEALAQSGRRTSKFEAIRERQPSFINTAAFRDSPGTLKKHKQRSRDAATYATQTSLSESGTPYWTPPPRPSLPAGLLADIPLFTGEDFEYWYGKLEAVAEDIPDNLKVQAVWRKLGPIPFKFARGLPDAVKDSFHALISALQDEFGDRYSKRQAARLFFSSRQQREQSTQAFENELRSLAHTAFPRPLHSEEVVEDLILDRLVEGLRSVTLRERFALDPPQSTAEIQHYSRQLRELTEENDFVTNRNSTRWRDRGDYNRGSLNRESSPGFSRTDTFRRQPKRENDSRRSWDQRDPSPRPYRRDYQPQVHWADQRGPSPQRSTPERRTESRWPQSRLPPLTRRQNDTRQDDERYLN